MTKGTNAHTLWRWWSPCKSLRSCRSPIHLRRLCRNCSELYWSNKMWMVLSIDNSLLLFPHEHLSCSCSWLLSIRSNPLSKYWKMCRWLYDLWNICTLWTQGQCRPTLHQMWPYWSHKNPFPLSNHTRNKCPLYFQCFPNWHRSKTSKHLCNTRFLHRHVSLRYFVWSQW